MMGYERSDDYQPLFYVQGRPVHVTTLLVAIHAAALVVCCLLKAFTGFNPWEWLGFSTDAVLRHGQLWRIATYNFSHAPGVFFLLDMVFLFLWGREVEKYFGRKIFATLYAALVLAAPTYLLARGLLLRGEPGALAGSQYVDFGVFILFATIYPNVQFWFGIACKWFAWGLLAIWTLQFLAANALNEGIALWLTVAVAYFGARYASIGSEAFGALGNWRPRLPRKPVATAAAAAAGVKPRLKPRRAADAGGGGSDDYRDRDVHESIDPLLDKISQHGIGSLTSSERATLERARVSLLRKEKGD